MSDSWIFQNVTFGSYEAFMVAISCQRPSDCVLEDDSSISSPPFPQNLSSTVHVIRNLRRNSITEQQIEQYLSFGCACNDIFGCVAEPVVRRCSRSDGSPQRPEITPALRIDDETSLPSSTQRDATLEA
nr:hypothetical protein CFP56_62185 [Quercus suber]